MRKLVEGPRVPPAAIGALAAVVLVVGAACPGPKVAVPIPQPPHGQAERAGAQTVSRLGSSAGVPLPLDKERPVDHTYQARRERACDTLRRLLRPVLEDHNASDIELATALEASARETEPIGWPSGMGELVTMATRWTKLAKDYARSLRDYVAAEAAQDIAVLDGIEAELFMAEEDIEHDVLEPFRRFCARSGGSTASAHDTDGA